MFDTREVCIYCDRPSRPWPSIERLVSPVSRSVHSQQSLVTKRKELHEYHKKRRYSIVFVRSLSYLMWAFYRFHLLLTYESCLTWRLKKNSWFSDNSHGWCYFFILTWPIEPNKTLPIPNQHAKRYSMCLTVWTSSGGLKHRSSGGLNLRTRLLLLNPHIMRTSKPSKN